MIYTIIDFLRSRLGQVLILSIVVIAVAVGVGAHHRKREQEQMVAGAFPLASNHPHWDKGKTIRMEGEDVYGHVEPNSAYEPFTPPIEKAPAPPRPSELSRLRLESKPKSERFEPLSSLIASERAVRGATEGSRDESKTTSLLIEAGALLHCHLTAPVSSDQGDALVLAELTQSLVRRGRVLLPVGTRLVGKLQNARGRLHFAKEWKAELPSGEWIALAGQVQEKALDAVTGQLLASDGRAGLPSMIDSTDKSNDRLLKLMDIFASAATRIAQDRIQTVVGERISSSVRGSLLEAEASEVSIDRVLRRTFKEENLVTGAGSNFYLAILAPSSTSSSSKSVGTARTRRSS